MDFFSGLVVYFSPFLLPYALYRIKIDYQYYPKLIWLLTDKDLTDFKSKNQEKPFIPIQRNTEKKARTHKGHKATQTVNPKL